MSIIGTITGMGNMTDQVIATDLLIAAKSGVRNYAIALTEAATPEVRTVLHGQLRDAINFHEEVTHYMMARGWYHPFNTEKQIRLDFMNSDTAQNLVDKGNLFV